MSGKGFQVLASAWLLFLQFGDFLAYFQLFFSITTCPNKVITWMVGVLVVAAHWLKVIRQTPMLSVWV